MLSPQCSTRSACTAPGVIPLDVRTKEQFDVDLFTYDFPVFSTDWRIGRQFLRVGRRDGQYQADARDKNVARAARAEGFRAHGARYNWPNMGKARRPG